MAILPHRSDSISTVQSATTVHNGADVSRTFTLSNDSNAAVTIERIVPSCGCTSAAVLDDPEPHAEIPPHGTLRVTVTLESAQLLPGPFDKTVAVYVVGQKVPNAILEVKGTCLPSVVFSTKSVSLTNSDPNAVAEVRFGVKLEPGPIPAHSEIDLKLRVENVALGDAPPVTTPIPGAADPFTPAVPQPPFHELHGYQAAIVNPKLLGHFHGEIVAVITDGDDGKQYEAGSIPINEDVTGELAAMPETASFGSVSGSATTELMITAATKAALTIASDSKYLTGTITPFSRSVQDNLDKGFNGTSSTNEQHGDSIAYNLELRLAAEAPEGPFSASVDIHAPSGTVLRIPVYALVTH